jgi:CelD/BcsL family acetyltransferase involved in cellulose biosynthesis
LSAQLLDPLNDARWPAFVERSPEATVFHHPAWLELLGRRYGYPLAACCLLDVRGNIRAGAPLALVSSRLTGRRLVCLPFCDRCPPLTGSDVETPTTERLVDALDALRRSMRLALQVHAPLPAHPAAWTLARYHDHVLPLEADVDAVVRRFRRRSSILRAVRRAERVGLVVERRTDVEALRAFYRLHAATRRRQGVPVQPRRFIEDFAGLFDRGLGHVLLVQDGGRPVAAAVFLSFKGTLTYKYGASDPAALDKRPNNLLFMDAVRWGCHAGMDVLDFGRTDLGHESLREFKLSWGADERPLEYHCLSDGVPMPREAPLADRAAPVLRRAPIAVNRLLGELLYRHFG